MNTIIFLRLLWKTMLRTLSIEEFAYLLKSSIIATFQYETKSHKRAKWLLRVYFKKPLSLEELKLLVEPSFDTAQSLWLKVASKRTLSEDELNYVVRYMPWNFIRKFPAELAENHLKELFSDRNPYKIISYCRDYSLPEEFEQLLIDEYCQSLLGGDGKMTFRYLSNQINGWKKAIEKYLDFNQGKRMKSKHLQKQLFELNDSRITEKLVLCSTIFENRLDADVTKSLLEQNNVEAIRLLLRESYLDDKFENLLKDKMPQLLPQYQIAKHRRACYLENENNYSVWAFNRKESAIIYKYAQVGPDDIDMLEFQEYYIKPHISSFGPCMQAYIAYHFPSLANDIWLSLLSSKS